MGSLKHNPVAKFSRKFNKAKVFVDRKKKVKMFRRDKYKKVFFDMENV